MKQSFLTNDRIYLRAVEPEDMDIMYEMENDPSMWDISNFYRSLFPLRAAAIYRGFPV